MERRGLWSVLPLLGPDGLAQFVKSIAKILAVAGVSYWTLEPHFHEFRTLSALDPAAMLPFSAEVLRQLVFAVIALMLVITGADWLWQKQRFLKKQMMSRHEIKEEYKREQMVADVYKFKKQEHLLI